MSNSVNAPISKQATQDAGTIWNQAVAEVKGDRLVEQNVSIDAKGRAIRVLDHRIELNSIDRVFVFGAGKASAAMAVGIERCFGPELSRHFKLTGQVHTSNDQVSRFAPQLENIEPIGVRRLSENFPTEQAEQATRNLVNRIRDLNRSDLCLGLISGGGSAMLTLPPNGISIEDKKQVARVMSSAGANIHQLNRVRQNLSLVKGGRLLDACPETQFVSLLISDVINDDLGVIASGPTVCQPADPGLAMELLDQFDPDRNIPKSVYRLLADAIKHDEHVKFRRPREAKNWILGNNRTAIAAGRETATELGYLLMSDDIPSSNGEANQVGIELADFLLEMATQVSQSKQARCLVTGGESTVNLVKHPGRGGRNQQLVLSALDHLFCHGHGQDRGQDDDQLQHVDFSLLSAGTDGEDGSTDVAGAVLNHGVLTAVQQRDEISRCLRGNDAMTFFEPRNGLFNSGPTDTNVCDIQVITVLPASR